MTRFLMVFLSDVAPVGSELAELCSRGLQDKLLRTIAAISSSMSTSSGLLWLQEERKHGEEKEATGVRNCSLDRWR